MAVTRSPVRSPVPSPVYSPTTGPWDQGVPTQAEATAFFARMATPPDSTTRSAVNRLVYDLKQAGVYATTDRLYVYMGASALADKHLNVISSTGTTSVIGGTITSSNDGLSADNVGYLSGVGSANAMTHFTQNNCEITVLITKAISMTVTIGLAGTGNNVNINREATRLNNRINSSASRQLNAAAGVGVVTTRRNGTDETNDLTDPATGLSTTDTATTTSSTISANQIAPFRNGTGRGQDQIGVWMCGAHFDTATKTLVHEAFLRYADAMGWDAPPLVTTSATLTALSDTTLPDGATGSDAGKGFTCTGLVKDASNGTWWVGNYGQNLPGAPSRTASVVNLSSNFSTILSEIELVADLGLAANSEVQGVTEDTTDGTLFICSGGVQHITKAGVLLGTLGSGANGVTYDFDSDCLVVCTLSTLYRMNKTTGAVIGQTFRMPPDELDHVQYIGDGIVLLFFGANGSPGYVQWVDLDSQWGYPAVLDQVRLTSSLAMEAGYLDGNTLYNTCDEYFHGVGSFNTVQTYDFTGLAP